MHVFNDQDTDDILVSTIQLTHLGIYAVSERVSLLHHYGHQSIDVLVCKMRRSPLIDKREIAKGGNVPSSTTE